jgi:hypothetical protein
MSINSSGCNLITWKGRGMEMYSTAGLAVPGRGGVGRNVAQSGSAVCAGGPSANRLKLLATSKPIAENRES